MRIAVGIMLGVLGFVAISAQADDKADIEKELKKFQGTWTFESVETGGKEQPSEGFQEMSLTFDGDKYAVKLRDMVVEAATMKLDPSKTPKAFDVTVTEGPNKGAVMLCIYEFSGDKLKVCFVPEGNQRPTEFKTGSGPETLVVHKRAKK